MMVTSRVSGCGDVGTTTDFCLVQLFFGKMFPLCDGAGVWAAWAPLQASRALGREVDVQLSVGSLRDRGHMNGLGGEDRDHLFANVSPVFELHGCALTLLKTVAWFPGYTGIQKSPDLTCLRQNFEHVTALFRPTAPLFLGHSRMHRFCSPR